MNQGERIKRISIAGKLIRVGEKAERNQAARVIAHLIRFHLILVGERDTGWIRLYRDPTSGLYWEHTFPHGKVQTDVSSVLTRLPEKQARAAYGYLPPDPSEILMPLASREGGRIILYRNVAKQSYWEHTYEQDAQWDEPPRMTYLSEEEVRQLYGRLPLIPLE